jgi:aryl-alcohol dehydrogenase-like predicted oxidoreductase
VLFVNNDSVLSNTVNNIDTSLSFRYMKSERVVGSALKFLQDYKKFDRNEVFLSSKGGFIQEDADNNTHSEETLANMFKDSTSNL